MQVIFKAEILQNLNFNKGKGHNFKSGYMDL